MTRQHRRACLQAIVALALAVPARQAHAQSYVDLTPPASHVSASTSDSNLPAHTVDKNLSTYWSGRGDGAWIRYDLGVAQTIGYVRIAFLNANKRQYSFDVQLSGDATSWTTVLAGALSGSSTGLQLFDFADVSARYVRYVGHGSTANTWNSLTEVEIWGIGTGTPPPTATPTPTFTPTPTPTVAPTATPPPAATDTPTPAPGSYLEVTPGGAGVTASTHDGNVPPNTVDNDLNTRWSGNGDGQWIQYDLGTTRTVGYLKIAFYSGNTRQAIFDLQLSGDAATWTTVWSGQSSGTTTLEETFDFADTSARYVRYLGHGNTTSTWNSLTETSVFAVDDGTITPTPTPTMTPTPSPTPTAPPVTGCPPAGTSPLWNQYVQAKQNGTEPILPDFSNAGYHHSELPIPTVAGPIFNVTDYGAWPNDGLYDDETIQAAINAATNAGGGVVYFPAGQYLVSPSETSTFVININASRIVLRGAGSGLGGTEIVMVSKRNGLRMFNIFKPSWTATTVANITQPVTRESSWVTVNSSAQLRVGQWVILRHQSTQYNDPYFSPLTINDTSWTRVAVDGVPVHEVHQIAEIVGNSVRFREPAHFNIVLDSVAWRLDAITPLEEVGIEDIRFTGRWDQYPETFVHHKDWIHDSGWSFFSIKHLVNSWMRRVEFLHTNQAIGTDTVSFSTFEGIRYTGKKGHTSFDARRGYGVLIKDNEDAAAMHHGPGSGYQSVNTVILRHQMQVNQSIDHHGGVPHATLHDSTTGGYLRGMGGPYDNYPHHGKYLVFWNFEHRSTTTYSYDFWDTVNRDSHTFALPMFAGFTANTTTSFQNESTEVGANESFGTPVTPSSLFEAQLKLRLCQ